MRADLAERGIDLAGWWQARRWRALLEVIDHLPRASRTNAAIANDPRIARMIATERAKQLENSGGDESSAQPWAPPAEEFDLTAQLLSTLINEMRALRRDVGSLVSSSTREIDMMPLPRRLVDDLLKQAMEQAEQRETFALVAMVAPHVDLASLTALMVDDE